MMLAAGLAVVAASFLITTLVARHWLPSPNPPARAIHVTQATYGDSCRSFVPPAGHANLVKAGNATALVSQLCDNTDAFCPAIADPHRLGDPAFGCDKDFVVDWRCGADPTIHQFRQPPEIFPKVVWIDCRAQP